MSWDCSFCATEVPSGASICRGCGAELIIGASSREMMVGAKCGTFVGLLSYILLLGQFHRLSFTFNHMLVALFLGFVAGAAIMALLNKDRIRFFRAGRNF